MRSIFRTRRGLILLIVLVGFILRSWAAFQLPVDADEPTYMQAAFDYAQMIKSGNWLGVIDYQQNREHPPLVKLLYSVTVLSLKHSSGWSDGLLLARMISVVFGTLAVWLLALINPLAGGLLAIQNMTVKYTAEAYLEAVPLFASVAAVAALYFSKATRDRLFWLSAMSLGLAAAGKYSYFPIFFVILYLYGVEKKYLWRDLLFYLGVAVVTFAILDPTLWVDPIQRLAYSVTFHAQYSLGAHVQEVNYPWYQPFLWVSQSWPNVWHPRVFFFFSFDGIIFWFALAGLYMEWHKRRWTVVWFLCGMLALLLWPTKWPQYTLVVIPALCLSASSAMIALGQWLRKQEEYWGWFSTMIPIPPRAFFIALVGVISFLVIFISANAISIAIERRNWSHMLAEFTPLPSNTVYAITPYRDGQMALGTEKGAAIWSPAAAGDVQDRWSIFNQQNSGLPNDTVLSVKTDGQGNLWFGTRSGLARYDGVSWHVYHAQDFGLNGDEVHAITAGSGGKLWIGTNAGAAVFDGKNWTPYVSGSSGLIDNLIFSLIVEAQPGGEQVWFGTSQGLCSLDTTTGAWTAYNPLSTGLGTGGIRDLLIDASGRLWVATLGGGISVWNGREWTHYRISDSGLPTNSVEVLEEVGKGTYWISNAFPERPGGLVSRFDGNTWKTYLPYYTGYSGAETVTIAQDGRGRLWFGTLTAGIDIFDINK